MRRDTLTIVFEGFLKFWRDETLIRMMRNFLGMISTLKEWF